MLMLSSWWKLGLSSSATRPDHLCTGLGGRSPGSPQAYQRGPRGSVRDRKPGPGCGLAGEEAYGDTNWPVTYRERVYGWGAPGWKANARRAFFTVEKVGPWRGFPGFVLSPGVTYSPR